MKRFLLFIATATAIAANAQVYKDRTASPRERAESIVKEMTLDEKISLMRYESPAIPRLGIEQYNWWNEALHGVSRAGIATVFPQPIGMAATFDDKLVYEVMNHRTDVQFLDVDDDTGNWEKIMIETRYSVYPVYKDNTDNILGILNIKDYFKYKPQGKSALINKAIKPTLFVPETQHIDNLFHNMQKSRIHFAFAVDEYGGISGIVTMNDLLEEIVGELEDDTTAPPSIPNIKQINKNSWVIHGHTPIEEVEKAFELDLSGIDCETFAGFIFSLMDEIPLDKKNIKLNYQNIRIKLVKTNGHKIEQAILQKVEA